MRHGLRTAFGLWLLATLVTGLLYPLAIWGIGRLFYPASSSGGEQFFEGRTVGLHQIGQQWKDPAFFWGRPSSAPQQENWAISGSSALSPASKELYAKVMERTKHLELTEGPTARPEADKPPAQQPSDLLFSSASGLDPHILRESALYQIPRIAKARNLNNKQEEMLVQLVNEFPGESMLLPTSRQYIHVLSLNLTLSEKFGNFTKQK